MNPLLEHGVAPDPLLAANPDCPVFGFNLACAYPFPPASVPSYRAIASRLAALDPGVYVYPEEQTHITIMTFVSFRLHLRPDAALLARLQSLIQPVSELVRPLLARPAFELIAGQPLLNPKAAILPLSDPAGEIARIRQSVSTALAAEPSLRDNLVLAGLNSPGIIHSTIMRFKAAPQNLPRFLEEFDLVAAATVPFPLSVSELLLTTETKPYMREGAILQRYPLIPT